MLEQQLRPRGVGLQSAGFHPRLQMQHHAFVAEADAEVLKTPVPAPGLRQYVVQLIAEHGRGMTGRSP